MATPQPPRRPDADRLERLEHALVTGRIDRRGFVRLSVAAGFGSVAMSALADELDAIRANQAERVAKLLPKYDVIVCGGGSAACALVGRLAADGRTNILLIEAGDWDTAPSVQDPRLWFTNLGTERDWGHVAEATASTRNRAIPEHMGRVLGGGSSINATIWVRPHANDLAHWAEVTRDRRWGYEHALSVFRRMENWQGTPDARYRGRGGPVWCEPSQNPHPLAPAMLEACRSLGLPVFDDLNGKREESEGGFALMNHIIREGRRVNLARAYLYPVLARPNVTVLTGAHVDRVLLQGDRASAVEVVRHDRMMRIEAGREIVLSTGGINTPKLLMLSGIGDEAALRKVGIPVRVDAPEVGRNFQDHLLHGGCLWESPEPIEHRNSGAEASGFWKSSPSVSVPDMNLVQIELPYASDVVSKTYAVPANAWALCAGLVAPKSRGRVTLRSANPSDKPLVVANFLSHPDDVRCMARAIELCRSIGNAAPLRPFAKREAIPGKTLSAEAMDEFARIGATTFFHASGTARMGRDAKSVVDPELRVRGVRGLRIADSSVMPRIVSVATMATCALIGERAAELMSPA
jgi:choline dehydrogenase